MLHMAVVFLVIGLIAALLGFTTIAGASIAIAKFLAGLFLLLFLVFLILGVDGHAAHHRLTALIQWRISAVRDLPLNARPLPLFTAAATVAFLDRAGRGAVEPAGAARLAHAAVEGRPAAAAVTLVGDQEFVALDDLAAAFQLTVREEALGAITVSYKGKTIVLTPDQALASVAGRLVSLPAPPSRGAAAAGSCRSSSSAARWRSSTTRGSICANRRACSSSATCACRASPSGTIRSAHPDG